MKRTLGVSVSIVLLTCLSLIAQDGIRTSYDPHYDFSRVKTFTVKVGPAWGDPASEAYAQDAVAKELNAKGWTQASDESSADVLVVIQGVAEEKEIQESFYSGTGRDPGWPGPPGVTSDRVIRERFGEGTINIFDVKTNSLIFTGQATSPIARQEKKNDKKIKKAVEKVFKNFPPKAPA